MPFVPVEESSVMAPPRPAGRFVPLDEADFEQFAQTPEPVVLPSEQPKPAPRKKVGGFLPIESRGLEEPKFFEEIEEFGPDVEQFLATLPTASREQLATIRAEIGKMPEGDRAALKDAVYMRHGPSAFGIAGNTTSKELVQRADPNKEINLAPGAAGAFGRAVIGSSGPTTGGIAGAAAGSRVPGPLAVKIPATILGVLGGAYAGYKGQEFAENKLLGEERAATLARQRMADIEAQPGATFAGEVLPSMAFLRPNASGLKAAGDLAKQLVRAEGKEAVLQTWRSSSPEARAYLVNSAFGSGVDTTLQTIREAMREDGIDLAGVGRILAAAGIGASQVDPTRLGRRLGLQNTIDLPAQRLPDVTPTRFDEDPKATAALLDIDQRTSSIPLDEAGRRVTGGEPTGIRLPDILTAEEAAAQGLPFQRGAVTRTPADEAALAAGRQAEDATVLAARENTMQELASELSRVTGEPFESIVARRAGKTDAAWLSELNAGVENARLNAANQEAQLAATTPEPEDIPLPGDIRYLETQNRTATEQTRGFSERLVRITEQFRRDGIPVNAETRKAASALANATTPAEYNLLRKGIYDRFAPKTEQAATARTQLKSLSDLNTPARPTTQVATQATTQVAPTTRTLFHGGPTPTGEPKTPLFMTSDREGAAWYARERGGDTRAIGSYDATLSKTLDIDSPAGIEELIRIARSAGADIKITGKVGERGWGFFSPDIAKHSDYDGNNLADLTYIPSVRKALIDAGYDSVKVQDMLSNDFIDTVVVLDPKKLKAVGSEKPARLDLSDTPAPPESAAAPKAAETAAPAKPAADVAPDPFAPKTEGERIARARPSEPSKLGVKSYGDTTSARVERPPSTPEEDVAAYKQLDDTFDALPNKEKRAFYDSTVMLREDLKNRHFNGDTPTESLLSERYPKPKEEPPPAASTEPAPKAEPKTSDFWNDAYAKAEENGMEVKITNRKGKTRTKTLEGEEASKALKTQNRVVNNLRAILDCLTR